jgi:hypothetical protein
MSELLLDQISCNAVSDGTADPFSITERCLGGKE